MFPLPPVLRSGLVQAARREGAGHDREVPPTVRVAAAVTDGALVLVDTLRLVPPMAGRAVCPQDRLECRPDVFTSLEMQDGASGPSALSTADLAMGFVVSDGRLGC